MPLPLSDQIPRDALVHDLAIVLAGSLHPSAEIGPRPGDAAARRMRDVLGILDRETAKGIEARLRSVLADDATPVTAPVGDQQR